MTLNAALQSPAPGAVIELYQLQLNMTQHGVNETYYFHAGLNELQQPITWQGQQYTPLPVEADGFEWNGQGSLPRPTLRVSNIFGTITALISTLPSGLEGAKVTRIRTLGRFLDAVNFPGGVNPLADPTAEWPREIYYIDRKSAENREVVEFELRSAFDLTGIRAPKRQCVSRCQWEYKGTECGYGGSLPTCTKTLDDCKSHFGATAELPFGGFPGIGSFFA